MFVEACAISNAEPESINELDSRLTEMLTCSMSEDDQKAENGEPADVAVQGAINQSSEVKTHANGVPEQVKSGEFRS